MDGWTHRVDSLAEGALNFGVGRRREFSRDALRARITYAKPLWEVYLTGRRTASVQPPWFSRSWEFSIAMESTNSRPRPEQVNGAGHSRPRTIAAVRNPHPPSTFYAFHSYECIWTVVVNIKLQRLECSQVRLRRLRAYLFG